VMGLAILPGRLQTELAEIRDILLGRVAFETIDQPGHTLLKHLDWIQAMQQSAVAQQAVAEVLSHKTAGTREQPDALDRFLQDEISRKFKTGLEHCGVFKHNELGNKALGRFMISAGFTVQNQQ
ncbi:MAG: galactose-phosphate uridylyltransferase, partial [Firmicutes bacterium]|nr:galactose-phosphate uridylyltransferase [Bacillota bacterium]